jgi:hypothetical protein
MLVLAGNLPEGPGRGSENKVPFVAAMSLNDVGRPMYIKMAPVPGFALKAISKWAKVDLSPGCVVISDGSACFADVTEQPHAIIAGGRKPKDLPEFKWINTALGDLKASLGGPHHAFDFAKCGSRYLGAFAYRFNRRFDLGSITTRLIVAFATIGPRPATWIRQAETSC